MNKKQERVVEQRWLTDTDKAAYEGVTSKSTYRRWLKDPEFAAAMKQAAKRDTDQSKLREVMAKVEVILSSPSAKEADKIRANRLINRWRSEVKERARKKADFEAREAENAHPVAWSDSMLDSINAAALRYRKQHSK